MLAHFVSFPNNCVCDFWQVLPQHVRAALNFRLRKKEVSLTTRRTNAIPDRVNARAIHCQVSALGKFLSDARANFERTHAPQLRPDFAQSRCQSALEPRCFRRISVVQRACGPGKTRLPTSHRCTTDSNLDNMRAALFFVSHSKYKTCGSFPTADSPPRGPNGVLVPPEWKNIRHF